MADLCVCCACVQLAGLQQQIQRFSSLPQIVEKYGFQQSLSAQRIMQPNAAAA